MEGKRLPHSSTGVTVGYSGPVPHNYPLAKVTWPCQLRLDLRTSYRRVISRKQLRHEIVVNHCAGLRRLASDDLLRYL
jgi:hypothetical protein